MQTFTWSFTVAPSADESILASIATPAAYILFPIVGVLSWQLAAATITGLIAKENVVGTLAVCFVGLENLIDTEELAMTGGANTVAMTMGLTSVTALAYLFFNLYTPPCFAAIGAMNSEMKSKGWLWGAIGLQLATGYTVAFLINQFGTLFTEGHLARGFVPGLIAEICFVAAVVLIGRKVRAHFDEQYELHKKASHEGAAA
jgi:ferrous iron transport protein B